MSSWSVERGAWSVERGALRSIPQDRCPRVLCLFAPRSTLHAPRSTTTAVPHCISPVICDTQQTRRGPGHATRLAPRSTTVRKATWAAVLLAGLAVFPTSRAAAEPKLHGLFGDHMVQQR